MSSDQNERKKESIGIQIDMARRFAENWNQNHGDKMVVVGCYTDKGKTGTNFDRDAFKRLMQDIRLGKINCIIVKDLSRFGRNYLEAGNYIEKIFPFLGVRFIAVSDGYDTGADGNNARQMASEIMNLVNDMYAKDSSKKAKISLKQRREEGSYVGGPPPYGYMAVWEDRVRKLIPDENTAGIVRCIYEQFLKMKSYQAVADELNRKKINPPAVYKKTGEVYCLPDAGYKGWDKSSVERILKSETYIGKLVQGKTSITARDESTRIHKDAGEWVITGQAHEKLIDRSLYEEAAEIRREMEQRSEKKKSHSNKYPIEENLYDHVLFCGVCGRKMTRNRCLKHFADGREERRDGYFCLNAASTKTDRCPVSNRISQRKLTDIMSLLLKMEFSVKPGRQKCYMEKGRQYIKQAEVRLEQERRTVELDLAALKEEEGRKYIEYRMGCIPQKDYIAYQVQKEERLRKLQNASQELSARQIKLEREGKMYLQAICSLIKGKPDKELTKELLETLVEKIYIYPGRRVETVFLYTDAFTGEKEER